MRNKWIILIIVAVFGVCGLSVAGPYTAGPYTNPNAPVWGTIVGTLTNQPEFTPTPTASKTPIADGSGKLDGWITTPLYPSGSGSALTGVVYSQSTTPGTAQTGNLNISGTGVFGVGITGTLNTAAQVNITSLGTLSGLTVTNPIAGSVTGNAGSATLWGTYATIAGPTQARIYTFPNADKTLLATDGSGGALTEVTYLQSTTPGSQQTGSDNLSGTRIAGTFNAQTSFKSDKQAYYTSVVDNGDSGSSKTVDWTLGNIQKITTTAACTLTFTAPTGPCHLTLKIIHEASTTSYVYVWPGTVKWQSATAPNTTNTSGAVDVVNLFYDGATYYGTFALDLR